MLKHPGILPLFLAGLLLAGFGANYLALLAAGETTVASIDNRVRHYGASRGTIYTVYYSFEARAGGIYRNSASTSATAPPRGSLRVRYLAFWPVINHPGTNGLLGFYAAVGLIPAALMIWLATRLQRSRRK